MGYEGQSLSKASTGEAGGFELCANPMGCAPKGGDREIDTHYKMKALSLNKIPPNPPFTKGGITWQHLTDKQVTFPLCKRGIEGDFAARASC